MPPREHWTTLVATMGDGVEWVLLIACEVRDAAKCTGQILITKNAPIPNANSAEVEKLF